MDTPRGLSELLKSSTAAMTEARRVWEAAARTDLAVLVTGESGVGKEVVARSLHERSARARGPFVAVHCGALPRDLVEAELFGYRRGAFTGAVHDAPGLVRSADHGTLFLDEIGDMPLDSQVKLLRVLQSRLVRPIGQPNEQRVDVRVVAATNRNLEEAVDNGTFRMDLFYRLNVLRVDVPALRSRLEDLPELVAWFQSRVAARLGHARPGGISQEALRVLLQHAWPGNLRELENVVESSTAVAGTDQIRTAHLPAYLRRAVHGAPQAASGVQTLRQLEVRAVREVLERVGQNKSKAARVLGISRSCLYSMLAKNPDGESA